MKKPKATVDYDEFVRVRDTLASLIVWTAQSSASPISIGDTMRLLKMLEGDDEPASEQKRASFLKAREKLMGGS